MPRNPPKSRGLRVVAGECAGLRLAVPRGHRTRPTADRVKESVFGALGPSRLLGVHVLDLYAGTGSLGIEALSRGASRAVFVDRDPAAVDAIRRNLAATGLADRSRVVRRGAGSFVRAGDVPDVPFGLVLCDPPYETSSSDLGGLLGALAVPGFLVPDATVVIERGATAGPPPLPRGWEVTWERSYGDTLVVLVAPAPAEPAAPQVSGLPD